MAGAGEPRPVPPGAGANSVRNALRLVEILAERKSIRVREAAGLLGLSEPTAYRLLSALHARGWVTQDHSHVYHWSAGFGPPSAPPRPPSVEAAVLPFLAEISEVTGHSVNFCILEGNGVRSLVGMSSRRCRLPSRDGWLLPAHSTSSGHVLLADLPEQELLELYPLGVPGNPRDPGFDLRELRRRIALVRRRGWALNDEVSERGIIALAVPVRDPGQGRAAGTLALVASAQQATSDEVRQFLPLLLETSTGVSNQL
ncbi:IclR family transcriptional regulator [Streptomyces sp. NPDC096132]|uniref:IclR family transcriptional regulator n=1 Tax=Streptomyces sp. NPDC096132 TaxID=3366075 RepID=UPI0037FF6EE3